VLGFETTSEAENVPHSFRKGISEGVRRHMRFVSGEFYDGVWCCQLNSYNDLAIPNMVHMLYE